jgi:hypothetical protein
MLRVAEWKGLPPSTALPVGGLLQVSAADNQSSPVRQALLLPAAVPDIPPPRTPCACRLPRSVTCICICAAPPPPPPPTPSLATR